MGKPYMIRIGSTNGGVGKTTIAVNLASALSMLKYKVLLVDGDTISPAVNACMGLDIDKKIQDVFAGKMDLELIKKINVKDVLTVDKRTGLYVLPSLVSLIPVSVEESDKYVVERVKELTDFDFVIMDTHAGLYYESILKMYDEMFIVSLPTMKSITFAIQLHEICKNMNLKTSLILNRLANKKGELGVKEIEEALGERALVTLPEDSTILESEGKHIPAVFMNKNAHFSKGVFELARICVGKEGLNKA